LEELHRSLAFSLGADRPVEAGSRVGSFTYPREVWSAQLCTRAP
jgi:hypothetical protein